METTFKLWIDIALWSVVISIVTANQLLSVEDASRILSIESQVFNKEELRSIQKELFLEVGGELDLRRINEGIQKLYHSENQRIIFVEWEKRGTGAVVIVRGTRFKKLKGISFNGLAEDIEEEILRSGTLQVGKPVELGKLSILREKIKSEYLTRGYPFANVEVEMNEEDKVTITVKQNAPTLVSNVNVSGVSAEDAKELANYIPMKRGGVYSKKAVDDSIEELRKYFKRNRRATSRVDETKIRVSEDNRSAEVTFNVRLGEQYQFEFAGNEEFDEFELRTLLTEEALSQSDAVMRIGEQIERKYRKVGFHFVKVDTKVEVLREEKRQIIRFLIEEGKRVIVDRVLFNGSNALSESKLESLFFEGAPGVLNRGLYWEEGIQEATGRLRQNLESIGFLSASLTGPRVAFSEDKEGVELIYDADLGNQSHFRQFEIQGNKKISESDLKKEIPYGKGDWVNWERLGECKKAILRKYRSEGYTEATLAESGDKQGLILSPDQRDGDVVFNVVEGKQYFVGTISIEGNKRTKSKVILRELTLLSGDKFDPEKLQESEENIALLQLFSRIEIVTYPNSADPSKKDLKIIVVEIKPGTGEIGLGAAYEEPRFRAKSFVGFQYRNLWGLNQTASQRTELTVPLSHDEELIPFIEYAVLLGYRAPYPFELPFTFFAQAGLDAYEISPLGGEPLLQTRAKIEERIERRLGKRVTGFYRLHRYERTTVEKLVKESTVANSPDSKVTNSIGSTGPGLIVDLRDDSFNPTRGSYHTFDFEVAHPSLLSDSSVGFMMAILRNSFYFPLSTNMGLILYAGAGYASSLFDTPIPVARLANDLSLGGQSSLRGYSSKEYQPNVNYEGDKLNLNPQKTAFLNGRVEVVTGLLENVNGAIFFDTGQLYPNLIPAGRKDGVGIGFRYKTPVGPVVIDIAHGFESRDKNVKFTFTIGSI